MDRKILNDRRKSLEESFFQKHDRKLLDELRDKARARKEKEALAIAMKITNDDVLDELMKSGFTLETYEALTLIPLVEVAWADGRLTKDERQAILEAAMETGIDPLEPSYALLMKWMEEDPGDELLELWENYVRGLRSELPEPAMAAVRDEVLRRSREVAEATRGLFGFGNRINKAERKSIARMEKALGL
ncbi:MAG: hypothetical protein HKN20_00830 [Gemmatimonadetes bacterium]|nr:hypothetical protein [Gemmatimonadota bacterium]